MRALQAEGQDPYAAFATRDYVVAAEARRGERFSFKKPTDVADFLLEAYLSDPALSPQETLAGIGALNADLGVDVQLYQRLQAGAYGINRASSQALYGPDGTLAEAVFTLMCEAAPAP